ncbi:MAG: hypothetical protein ACE144_02175 [Thermodesulfobacteriota bacterium]
MKRDERPKAHLFLPVFLFLVLAMTGCSLKWGVPQWSGSGFLRKEFLEYKRVAILPFEGDDSSEVSRAFARSLQERFPDISIVDRKRVLELFRGEALVPDRLDEEARRRIGISLGAQALITGNIDYPSITRWFLQVVIFDSETSRVMGRSLVEINFMGDMGKAEGARFAVEKLTLQ